MTGHLIRVISLIVGLASSCSRDQPPQPPSAASPPKIQTLTPRTSFDLPRAEKKAFINKAKQLKSSDRLEDVVKLLGPPYSVQSIIRKESEKPLGTRIGYFLRKRGSKDEDYADYDQEVVFDFNNKGVLEAILTNIKGLDFDNVKVVNTQNVELENLDDVAPSSKE